MATDGDEEPERHASWVELFFDLVVVAGVGQLAHLLQEDVSLGNVGLYVLLYLPFWTVWAGFTVYGNIAGDRARLPGMLLAMLGLGVMAAAVPGIRDEHTVVFVIAYVLLRWLAGSIWRRGQVVLDWPIAQMGAGALPWIFSLWVAAPGRYWLWGIGLGQDMIVTLLASRDRMSRAAQKQMDQAHRRRRPNPQGPTELQELSSDTPHLAERMGLFVIIVLGEGVIQIVDATSGASWDTELVGLALGAFVLLVGVWALSLLHGFAGVPQLDADAMPVRIAMALHSVITAAIAALAAGLGLTVAHAAGQTEGGVRWLLCAAIAAYFGVTTIAGLFTGSERRWVWGWGLPCTLVPVVLAAFDQHIPAVWLVWALVATVGWQVLYVPSTPDAVSPLRRLGAWASDRP